MNVLFSCGGEIGQRDLLEGRVVGLEIIGRIAVKLELLALIEDFIFRVVVEKEGVDDVVLGAFEVGLREGF